MTHDGSHTYYYDAENHLIQIDGTLGTCSTATACYVYDYAGRRVQRTQCSGTPANYLYDLDGRVNSEIDLAQGSFDNSNHKLGWVASYIYSDGSLLAEYANSTTYFVHQDHLSSTRLLTDVNGCVVDSLDYLPYGESYFYTPSCSASAISLKFTGKERDAESNLDNSQARYYSSQQGRFMLADPAGIAAVDPSNPQTWNQYAYVLETNGIPNGLQIPTLGLPGLIMPGNGGCTYGSGSCGRIIFGFQGPAIPSEVEGGADALAWLIRLIWPITLAKGGASQNPKPTWVRQVPRAGETADEFTQRVCRERYPEDNGASCGKGGASEYNRIRKWAQDWIKRHSR